MEKENKLLILAVINMKIIQFIKINNVEVITEIGIQKINQMKSVQGL